MDRTYYAVSRDGKSLVRCVDGMLLDNSATLGIVNTQVTEPEEGYDFYIWRAGDRLDSLAHELLGDSTRYYDIADMNYYIMDPTAIPPGEEIVVPGG